MSPQTGSDTVGGSDDPMCAKVNTVTQNHSMGRFASEGPLTTPRVSIPTSVIMINDAAAWTERLLVGAAHKQFTELSGLQTVRNQRPNGGWCYG
jgi:hypothetical protein